MTWATGQRVAYRRGRGYEWEIATIQHVTAAGRAVIGTYKFRADTGAEIGKYDKFRGLGEIKPLTPEIEAEIAFRDRSEKARTGLRIALERAAATMAWNAKVGTEMQIEAAERLADAIEAELTAAARVGKESLTTEDNAPQ
jgi:hypothetical protein